MNSTNYCKKLKLNCKNKKQNIIFKTSRGNFEVQLDGENYPVTVANFISNVRKSIYANKNFYKIINYPQVKVIHSGVYSENIFNNENLNLNVIQKSLPLEIKLKKGREPIYNKQFKDLSKISEIKMIFENGSLAMVKSGERKSSSTEFFFVTNKFPELDGRYSVFGKVVKGFEVLEKIDKKDLIYEIKISD